MLFNMHVKNIKVGQKQNIMSAAGTGKNKTVDIKKLTVYLSD